jgi:hypothetical protein
MRDIDLLHRLAHENAGCMDARPGLALRFYDGHRQPARGCCLGGGEPRKARADDDNVKMHTGRPPGFVFPQFIAAFRPIKA